MQLHLAKLNDRRLVRLLRHKVTVEFDRSRPDWSLVCLPIEGKPKNLWWVPATYIAWCLTLGGDHVEEVETCLEGRRRARRRMP